MAGHAFTLDPPDFITRAFVEALASYQQHHNLQPAYQISRATEDTQKPGPSIGQPSSFQVVPEESKQHTSSITPRHDDQQQPPPQQPSQRQGQKQSKESDHKQGKAQPAKQAPAVMQQQQQQQQQQQHAQAASASWDDPTYRAFWEWYSSGGYNPWAPMPPSHAHGQQQQQQYTQQQHRSTQQHHHHQQQQAGWHSATWSSAWQSSYWQPPPPPPPPPPMPPTCPLHSPWLGAACSRSTHAPHTAATGGDGTAADPASKTAASGQMVQMPADIAADSSSKAAAEAALANAVRLTGGNSHVAELMMAWFYAGYGAGKLASGAAEARGGGGE